MNPQPSHVYRAPTLVNPRRQSSYQHSSLSIPISSLLPIPICSLSPSYQRTVLSKKLEPIKLENQGTKGENKSIKPINKNPILDNTTQFPKSKNWEGYIATTRNSESESDKDGERYWSIDSLVECIVPSSAIALVDLLDPLHSRRRVKMNQRKKEKVKFLGDRRWVTWRSALFVEGFGRNKAKGLFD